MATEKKEEQAPVITSSRYWWAVLYQENMRRDWREKIDDLVQLPYAYCEHTLDKDSRSEHRKDHVHIILAKNNTTTYKHIMSVFNLLSAPGKKALNKCEAIINIRHAYDYLIHDTKSCEKLGKEKYDQSCRIEGNNFDIGAYEQISQQDKNVMLQEMLDFVVDYAVQDITTFYVMYPNIRDAHYFDVFKTYGSLIERMCKGNHHRFERGGATAQEPEN